MLLDITRESVLVRRMVDLGATMRDGVRLSVDVYLPDDETAAPAILVRTPYDNTRPDFVSVTRRFTALGCGSNVLTPGHSLVPDFAHGRS